jgi:nitroreductase
MPTCSVSWSTVRWVTDVELSEVMRTTGAVRDFTDAVVANGTIFEILDDARFAPSGSNRQGWHIVVVTDRAVRRQLAELMVPVWSEYTAQVRLGETAFSAVEPTSADLDAARAERQPNPLLDEIESVPVVLVVAVDLRKLAVIDKDTGRPSIVGGASIYPFCHNILLGARARGLGGVLTTLITRVEGEARPVLGLPDTHALAGMLFLGVPVHQPTRLRRRPVAEFATIDRFDGPPLTVPQAGGSG